MREISRNFWLRLGIVLILVVGGYMLTVFMPRQREYARQQLPKKSLIEFRNTVNQGYIAYTALAGQTGTDNTASLLLNTAQQNLSEANKDLLAALGHAPKEIDKSVVIKLKQIAQQQSDVLKEFLGRYNALQKPLSYLPESDLSLNKSTGVSRAKAAQAALSKLATAGALELKSTDAIVGQQLVTQNLSNFELSSEAQQSLASSAQCFGQFASQLQQGKSSAKSTLRGCSKAYATTRADVTRVSTSPLRTGKGAAIKQSLLEALKKIDAAINY